MTETEAFNKRCCRHLADTCVGSKCMAWRWDILPNPDYKLTFMAQYPPDPTPPMIPSMTDGHCGLAHG